MIRKVVKLGPATLVVSLPSKWVKLFGVKAGDELEIREFQRDLIIKASGSNEPKKETLDFRNFTVLMKRILVSRYYRGFDEIEVLVDSTEKSRTIQKRVDELVGIEVIEQTKDRLVLKAIGKSSDEDLDKILNRILYLLETLSVESLSALERKDGLEYLMDMEYNINRFTDYALRQLNRRMYGNCQESAVMYCVIFLLEELGDQYKKLVSYIHSSKTDISKDSLSLLKEIIKYHKQLTSLFRGFSNEKAIKLAKRRDELIELNKNETVLGIYYEGIIETIVKIMGQLLNTS